VSQSSGVIQVSGLQVSYQGRAVLQGVDLEVQAGEVVAILGGSGGGKSTLLKAILGLVPIDAGAVRLLGQQQRGDELPMTLDVLRRIGVLFQQGALLQSLTVAENVALPLEMHTRISRDLRRDIAQRCLEQVGLQEAGERLPAELSGGMRQRAALARALVLDPDLLLCDEPGAGLDPVTAAGIDQLLLELNRRRGAALVVVTHDLASIARLNGRVVMLAQGRVVFDGPTAQAHGSDVPAVHAFFHSGD
jgi:phospholipid/cholesterol/gamma-HCH transport system ATP-binding protein